jgi:GMP synthase-like glutamine amidotransferase
MSVLIIKNVISEGPGTIEEFLRTKKLSFRIVELGEGEKAPPLDRFQTLIVLGGPMGVYEMEKYSHLYAASRIIREAINRGMNILGICLGAQLIAHCLGAEVYPGGIQEIGWNHVELTGDGLKDPLMRKLAVHPKVKDFWRRFKVFQWHGDTFHLPMNTLHIARSALYANQAFRFSKSVYGLQFHIEVTKEMLSEWVKAMPDKEHILAETDSISDEYKGRAMQFYRAFFQN